MNIVDNLLGQDREKAKNPSYFYMRAENCRITAAVWFNGTVYCMVTRFSRDQLWLLNIGLLGTPRRAWPVCTGMVYSASATQGNSAWPCIVGLQRIRGFVSKAIRKQGII